MKGSPTWSRADLIKLLEYYEKGATATTLADELQAPYLSIFISLKQMEKQGLVSSKMKSKGRVWRLAVEVH